ncbi:UNKNOWN [Stylonychia lemnae]|uniref:Uncharacterized protein n=1 Tax=Stylonychia lemnae TaxID=5949 RepID=A0A078AF98_STYLE|nr:UNKNOWN [Stylonychia lemnae]|eukprot:CDW79593.1 UNKNOWN [Stylonychia lemnae]
MDSALNFSNFTYSQSLFVKETIKLHFQSLKTLIDQESMCTREAKKYDSIIGGFFQVNWKSILNLIQHSEMPKEHLQSIVSDLKEIRSREGIACDKVIGLKIDAHIQMTEIFLQLNHPGSKDNKKQIIKIKKILRELHIKMDCDYLYLQDVENEQQMNKNKNLDFPIWFMENIVIPYAYKLPIIVKQLVDKLELQEYQIDKQLDHYLNHQSQLSKKRRLNDSTSFDQAEIISCKNSKRRQQFQASFQLNEINLNLNKNKSVSFQTQKDSENSSSASAIISQALKSENLKTLDKINNKLQLNQKIEAFSCSQFSQSTTDMSKKFSQSQRSHSVESVRSFNSRNSQSLNTSGLSARNIAPLQNRVLLEQFKNKISLQQRTALRFPGSGMNQIQTHMKRAKSNHQQKSFIMRQISQVHHII